MRPKVLVTGASRGIGAACALRLAQEGWDVAIHFNSGEVEANKVAIEVEKAGGWATVLCADLGQVDECEDLVLETAEALGGLDAVVANAGVYDRAHLDELPPERWARTISVNLSGTFHVVRAGVPVTTALRCCCHRNWPGSAPAMAPTMPRPRRQSRA